MGIALLVIDVQKEYMSEHFGTKTYEHTMIYINETMKLFRGANCPVIIVRDISEGDGPEYALVDELKREPTDIEVLKLKGNAFWETNLEQILKDKDITHVSCRVQPQNTVFSQPITEQPNVGIAQ
jgi:nicotinamidase-related amidase